MKQINKMLPQIDGRYWLDKDGNLYTNNGAKKCRITIKGMDISPIL